MKKILPLLLLLVLTSCENDETSINPEIRFKEFEKYIGKDLDYFKEKNKKNLVQPKGKLSYYSVETANGFYEIYPESRCPVSGSCIDDWGNSDNYIIGGVNGSHEKQESLGNGIKRIKRIIDFNFKVDPDYILFDNQSRWNYTYQFDNYNSLFNKISNEEIEYFTLLWENDDYVYFLNYWDGLVTFSVRMNHNPYK